MHQRQHTGMSRGLDRRAMNKRRETGGSPFSLLFSCTLDLYYTPNLVPVYPIGLTGIAG
jgi:hypothetical protein